MRPDDAPRVRDAEEEPADAADPRHDLVASRVLDVGRDRQDLVARALELLQYAQPALHGGANLQADAAGQNLAVEAVLGVADLGRALGAGDGDVAGHELAGAQGDGHEHA